jgi:hypothetical protein
MNFNEAYDTALQTLTAELEGTRGEVYLVRDLFGKFRVLLPNDLLESRDNVAAALADALGNYSHPASTACLPLADLPGIERSVSRLVHEADDLRIHLVDRLLMGTEWTAAPGTTDGHPTRVTFYSMKGGVGRSTTVAVVAWHLARTGKKVLVFDLDLESPGVGSTLLPTDQLPECGAVDWFVEDAVGNQSAVVENMVAPSPLALDGDGQVYVVPAFGKETGDYLPKLGRVYLERGGDGPEPWPSRLRRMVRALEEHVNPDIVLLDSRTGLHDTSAALIMAMGAHTLMFAVDSRQTWTAYDYLLGHWAEHPQIREFRERLWFVASMVNDHDRDDYLKAFRDRAHEHLSVLYDADEDGEFSYSLEHEEAPHSPAERHVRWSKALLAFDPTSSLDVDQVELAYAPFLRWFERVLFPAEVTS